MLYDTDFNLWVEATIDRLKKRKFDAVDWDNLIEEIESLGRSDKRAIISNLIVVIMHLLKCRYQPEKRTNSWLGSIVEYRQRIEQILLDSPSLNPYLADVWLDSYSKACIRASVETGLPLSIFPKEPSFSLQEALDPDFFI